MADRELAVGLVGATGLGGREVLRLLEERGFPAGRPRLFGTTRTAGGALEDDEGASHGTVELLGPDSFAGLDLVFFTAGRAVAEAHALEAAARGALVVDTSSQYRLSPTVPLVVPEVNADVLAGYESGVVACPSAAVTALAVVLAPLAAAFPLARVVVSTYQGVASAGTRALQHLVRDSIGLLSGRGDQRRTRTSVAFDCMPAIGAIGAGGQSAYEERFVAELEKVLGDAMPPLTVTAVRVPAFIGIGLSVSVESEEPMTAAAVADVLRPAPGVLLHEGQDARGLSLRAVVGSEATHVGRLRTDSSVRHGITMWIAIDSVVKGRALNAVQVAERLIRVRH
ncbi:MAG TPA: aspartate-semialdehyde dehydrogenase [Candidatus Limnocylindria bacterium]|nr:aspartate-semialdehyde dehydrogenase [Candidatus Limnocylindria bacterium]